MNRAQLAPGRQSAAANRLGLTDIRAPDAAKMFLTPGPLQKQSRGDGLGGLLVERQAQGRNKENTGRVNSLGKRPR